MIAHAGRPILSLLGKLPSRPDSLRATGKRASVRRPVNVPVHVSSTRPAGGRTDGAWAINLSNGGVRILADIPLEVGEVVKLRIGDHPETGLYGRGRVVWVKRHGEDVVAGIEFLAEAA